jgi:uncharacterized protein with PIN domain
MPEVIITVLDELNELLAKKSRYTDLGIDFKGRQSIKHIIESLGIPHTEIGLLTTDERPIDFTYLVQDNDRVVVHPATPDNDNYSGLFNNDRLAIEPRFILDNHLGKLATYLRILGLDAIYHNDYQDDELAVDAVNLNRILLTRDRQLLMRKTIRHGYLIRSLEPEVQVTEVLHRFRLTSIVNPFNRCLHCNGKLILVEKETILHRLQPKTKKYFQDFHICPKCDRVYWKGSHYERMDQKVAELIARSEIEDRL